VNELTWLSAVDQLALLEHGDVTATEQREVLLALAERLQEAEDWTTRRPPHSLGQPS
jgi:hypothetical protein